MGQQTGVIKGFGGILRNADSLPYAATPYTWGYPSKVFVCGVAIFSRRNGMGNHVADIHPRHVAVALRQRVELFSGRWADIPDGDYLTGGSGVKLWPYHSVEPAIEKEARLRSH